MKIYALIFGLCATTVMAGRSVKWGNLFFNDNDFTTEFSRTMVDKMFDKNYVWSPLSTQLVMAAIMAGTEGDTYKQISEKVFRNLGQNNRLTGYLLSLKAFVDGTSMRPAGDKFLLRSFVALDQSFVMKDHYKRTLSHLFNDVEFTQGNFAANGGNTVTEDINAKVANATKGFIKEVIRPGSLEPANPLFVNAIHLKVAFEGQHTQTSRGTFQGLVRKKDDVNFMVTTFQSLPYYESGDIKIIKLPFVQSSFNFYVAMKKNVAKIPNEEGRKEWLRDLVTSAGSIISGGNFQNLSVKVQLPPFEINYSYEDMAKDLKSLGVVDVFDASRADFGKMVQDPSQKLAIAKLRQSAHISVSNQGAEAAIATAAASKRSKVYVNSNTDPNQKEFFATHPFVFYITAKHSRGNMDYESTLFTGQYVG